MHSWALPGEAVEAQSLSSGGASGPSPMEQYKHKVFANGPSFSATFRRHFVTGCCSSLALSRAARNFRLPSYSFLQYAGTRHAAAQQVRADEATGQPAGQAASQPTPEEDGEGTTIPFGI